MVVIRASKLPFAALLHRRRGNAQQFGTDRTRDITLHRSFRGKISQLFWRVWICRLTPAGRAVLTLTALLCAVGSNSLNIQAYAPLSYLFGIWAVALVAVLLYKPRMEISASAVERVRAGERLTIHLEMVQRRRFGVESTVLPFDLPPGLVADPPEGTVIPALGLGDMFSTEIGIRCSNRGVFAWRGSRVETDFPFGVLRSYSNFRVGGNLIVYPSFTPLRGLAIPSGKRYQPGGVAMSSDLGESFEYIGNRDYREGDSVRNIDWCATARLNTPVVREYRDEYFLRVGVVLDTHLPAKSGEQERENFERAVSVCASVADFMARSDYLVDVFAAGPNLYHLTAGRSLAYLEQILDILACVESTDEEPFETLEPEITSYLSRLTTVICVFVDWTESRREFVHRLATEGTAIKVIIVRDTACSLEQDTPDAYRGIVKISEADFARGLQEL